MATTENGVYYQDDYTKIADILADMKKMAESIDKLIEETEYDDKDVKNDIKTIQDEQKVQNKDIEDIQNKDTEQDKLIQKLQSNMINESTEEATSLHVADASDLPAVLTIEGNHYQETQEGTDNLAVLNEGSITQNGITINVENGVVNISGIATADTIIIIGEAYLYAGKTYYLSKDMYGGGYFIRNSQNEQKWFYDGETSVVMKNTGKCDVCVSFAANDTANKAVKLLISETSNANWVQGKKNIPSLEYSSEIETVKDNIKIIQCNSNFLKKQEETEITENGITGKVLDDGSIVLNGTTQYATYIQITEELQIGRIATGQNFKKYVLPKGSYKFNCQVSGQASDSNLNAYIRNSVNASSFSQALNRLPENSFKEIEFTTDKEEYVAYVWINSGITLTDFTLKFMLKRADDNSEYIQNEQKEYNLAVQKEMLLNDKFNLLNNKEMNGWNKTILNGTENWQQSSVISSVFFLDMQNTTQDKTKFELISNQYSYGGIIVNSNQAKHNKIYGFISEGILRQRILLRNDNFTTLDSFKASLAEKNMTLYYVASTTTELDLTEEQKEILKQLNNMELFKGVNNIYTEQDLALLQLDYTADTKMYINNKIASQNKEILNVAGGN